MYEGEEKMAKDERLTNSTLRGWDTFPKDSGFGLSRYV
jgi:hypothetical protein